MPPTKVAKNRRMKIGYSISANGRVFIAHGWHDGNFSVIDAISELINPAKTAVSP
ncbi:MAG: hypothetical protein ACREOO_31080 [bacterium]